MSVVNEEAKGPWAVVDEKFHVYDEIDEIDEDDDLQDATYTVPTPAGFYFLSFLPPLSFAPGFSLETVARAVPVSSSSFSFPLPLPLAFFRFLGAPTPQSRSALIALLKEEGSLP